MTEVEVHDECLWLKHLTVGPMKSALASLHSGSKVELLVDGAAVTFERMQVGVDGRSTAGFRPIGENRAVWRTVFLERKGSKVVLDFAGTTNA